MYYRRRDVATAIFSSAARRLFTTSSSMFSLPDSVSVTSISTVKPSSLSVTHDLSPFKLSLIDQLDNSTSASLLFFYPAAEKFDSSRSSSSSSSLLLSSHLKASLSRTLDSFYPLSGRLLTEADDMMFIHDYEKGVPFVEARVFGQRLQDFLRPPRMEWLNDLVPREPICLVPSNGPQVEVQLSTFDCGGVALGMSFLHRICDAATIKQFLRTWAALATGDGGRIREPDLLSASSVFPPRQSIPVSQNVPDARIGKPKRSNPRRFVFDSNAISTLRSMAKSREVENPSRTEALSAFIWKSIMKASTKPPVLSRLAQAVNIRSRMGQLLSETSVGNLAAAVCVSCEETGTFSASIPELVGILRKAVAGVDQNYLKSSWVEELLSGDDGGQDDVLVCTSLTGLRLSEFDFGLGHPVWVGLFGNARGDHYVFPPSHHSLVVLKEVGTPSINGNATEAWITLDEDLMVALEKDANFLDFATPNPPIMFS